MKLKFKQNGSTLVTALVMLIVLTLLVVSAIRSSTINLRIAGNMQTQEEAVAAAQMATERIISNNFTDPAIASTVQITVDINNDGNDDYNANVTTPVCLGSTAISNASLDKNNAADTPCYGSSTASQSGIIFSSGVPSTSGASWCLAQQWDVPATAIRIGGTGGVNVRTHQGVSLRVPAGTGC